MPLTGLFYIVCAVGLILNVLYYKSTKHPIKYGLIGGASGVIALLPAGFLMQYFGLSMAINYSTLLISVLLGIPGVLLMGVYTIFF